MKKIAGLLSLLLVAGCATPGKRTAIGAGAGAAAGATVGAIIGHQSGNRDKGALLGGVLGGLLGGTIGNRLDKQAQELAKIAETRRTESGIVTTLKNNLLFDTAKADLKPVAADSVNQISDILKQYPENKIIVVGFTDDRGSDAYNQNLSLQRAQAVRLSMVGRGVPAAAVEAVGMGEATPVAPNTTEEGRSKNRRVELQISADPSKVK
ncbi:MAG: OmpA family protein [Elusimicrobia bacterium]|jgi:outer membrane protein OmpA-like peptidoglycan-associated protein|nr:OmpA family protein [Elusimicrobiota bacterium]MBK7208059.1 OmpA family protein [Elusimicrobiota bacterium]MBK7544837.1 OmpA family protein [Elusimicrobiota bacterium]MBK7574349.1 OmpA family protein [Elusimicrobiota bacterium]MBK7688287.1 OmpA family protein [Elusimicrobiota bacterium]